MKEYFKPIPRFQKRTHPYDIGMHYSWWPGNYDRHFLNNIYERQELEFETFYQYHLEHFLKVNPDSEEVKFYKHVRKIIEDGIAKLIQDDNPNSKAKHERTNIRKEQLRAFTDYLDSIDKWHVRPPLEVLAEKDATIARLNEQVAKLEKRIRDLNKFEVEQKIRIEEGHLPTVIDLILQLKALRVPPGRELLRADNKTSFYKMVSKYFSLDGKDIPIETVKNYFTINAMTSALRAPPSRPKTSFSRLYPQRSSQNPRKSISPKGH
jgi:hypothetical protein